MKLYYVYETIAPEGRERKSRRIKYIAMATSEKDAWTKVRDGEGKNRKADWIAVEASQKDYFFLTAYLTND